MTDHEKEKRREEQKALKLYLRGRLIWDSSTRGTYFNDSFERKRYEINYRPKRSK